MLIIDDELMNISVMKAMINAKGFEVDIALSGIKALELIEERLDIIYSH